MAYNGYDSTKGDKYTIVGFGSMFKNLNMMEYCMPFLSSIINPGFTQGEFSLIISN